MLNWIKNFGRSKSLDNRPVPRIPPGQDAFLDYLYKNHPAYQKPSQPDEIGGPVGPEPTRYGTWERGGIDIDF